MVEAAQAGKELGKVSLAKTTLFKECCSLLCCGLY